MSLLRWFRRPSPVAPEVRPNTGEDFDSRYKRKLDEKRAWLAERGIFEPKPVLGLKTRSPTNG
jgi:hypothetical protein